jgi:hypothetical protein
MTELYRRIQWIFTKLLKSTAAARLGMLGPLKSSSRRPSSDGSTSPRLAFSPQSVLIGVEEDLPSLDGRIVRQESGTPPAQPHDSWCGMRRISIDWRTVEPLAELASQA